MTTTVPPGGQVELATGGMTCASCATRVERKLNKLDGVTATVNYATEKARVRFPGTVTEAELVSTVEAAGYTARLPEPPSVDVPGEPKDPETRALRQRLLISVPLAVPVVAMTMIPALQFDNWQWLSLTLAAPVVGYGGWPFHRAAWTNLRHGATTMDTLISMGTLAAFFWSLYALFLGTAGEPGMAEGFQLFPGRTEGSGTIYLETAAGVTAFLLAGRYVEARGQAALRRRAAGAAAARREGRRGAPRRRRGADPGRATRGRRHVRGPARREDRHRRHGDRRLVGARHEHADRRVGAGRGRPR